MSNILSGKRVVIRGDTVEIDGLNGLDLTGSTLSSVNLDSPTVTVSGSPSHLNLPFNVKPYGSLTVWDTTPVGALFQLDTDISLVSATYGYRYKKNVLELFVDENPQDFIQWTHNSAKAIVFKFANGPATGLPALETERILVFNGTLGLWQMCNLKVKVGTLGEFILLITSFTPSTLTGHVLYSFANIAKPYKFRSGIRY